jgi:two-component sensor histidine kinase
MLNKLVSLHAWPLWLRLFVSGTCLGTVYALQIPAERDILGDPFLLFFIVVIASALAFGELVGFVVCGASALLAMHFFEPFGSFVLRHGTDLVKVELYGVMCAMSVLGVARLRRAIALLYRAVSNNEIKSAILLEEMTHRMSNNFAVVAALIKSKASTIVEPDAKSILEEAVEQVITMARLHRNLHSAHGAIALDSQSFLSDLATDLKTTMGKGRPVSIASTAAKCPLAVAQAIPMGLIVNELVTNALKHAFPGDCPGNIRIILKRQSTHELALIVEDDGIGLKEHSERIGTGRGLIGLLTKQLGGHLNCKSGDTGASFSVTFPYQVLPPAEIPALKEGTLH